MSIITTKITTSIESMVNFIFLKFDMVILLNKILPTLSNVKMNIFQMKMFQQITQVSL